MMHVFLSDEEKEAMVHMDSVRTSQRAPWRSPEKVIGVYDTILEELQMKASERKYLDIYVNKGILWGTKR